MSYDHKTVEIFVVSGQLLLLKGVKPKTASQDCIESSHSGLYGIVNIV